MAEPTDPSAPKAKTNGARCAELLERYPELGLFGTRHLPDNLRNLADHFASLAWTIADQVPHKECARAQTSQALDLVWQAKNRAVMAQVLADYRPDETDSDDGKA